MDVNWTWKRLLSMLGMQNTILRYVLFLYFSKDWIDSLGDSIAFYCLVHEVQYLSDSHGMSLSLFHTSLITLYCLHIFCQSLHFVKFFCISLFSQRFAAVIMRIREPRTTALIFSSGKMVCTGAKRYKT